MGYEYGCSPDTFIGECRIGCHHLGYRHFVRSQAERYHGRYIARYTERPHKLYQLLRSEHSHKSCRAPVVRILKHPSQSNLLVESSLGAIARGERFAVGIGECYGLVYYLVARIHPLFHSKRIDEWFYGRPYLSASLSSHIVLEVGEVGSAHVSLDVAVGRLHTHKAHTSKTFSPQHRVAGRHYGVYLASPRKHLHIDRFVELSKYLRFAHTARLHDTVTLGA